MIHSQLGYYGQDISVFKSENTGFYKVYLDLSIMEMHIECKDISVDKISKKILIYFGTIIKFNYGYIVKFMIF